ncbi:MAG: AAA family ATPase [Sulfuricellaceae bacterium]
MLDQLHIRNFRMLEDFSVKPLGRVNLIVGRNNSGKSTVLEALRLLAEGGNGRFLQSLLVEHDELKADDFDADQADATLSAIRHFFTGRALPKTDDDFIFIGSDIGKCIKLEHVFFELKEEQVKDGVGNVSEGRYRQVRVPILKSAVKSDQAIRQGLTVTQQNGGGAYSKLWDMAVPWSSNRTSAADASLDKIPYGFIPTHFVDQDNLASLWDRFLPPPAEQRVLAALRIIEPHVEGLAFINTPRARDNGHADWMPVVKLRGQAEPIPLNSMGDGMFRLLQLVLASAQAKGGFLLVDEFENGLHFTVQEAVWRLVFQIAVELDMQVFATTHSWDCIESFVRVAKAHPKEGVLFKMSRSRLTSDAGKIIATVYDEERLALATAMEMEVR